MKDLGNALIGHSGFVGGTLLRQSNFKYLFNRKNVGKISCSDYDNVVCAAAPAQKWIANREPLADQKNIDTLISYLKTISCNTFILISTVDVFKKPVDVNEFSPVNEEGLHPYGLHRLMLEKFVKSHFSDYLIVRLPGLVGTGLRKNVIYDLLNENNLQALDKRAIFQFYPMVNLWWDIQIALKAELKLVHLTAEPISVAEVSKYGFGKHFKNTSANDPPAYDMRTCHATMFGGEGFYQYSQRETIQAVRAYAQTEPKVSLAKDEAIV